MSLDAIPAGSRVLIDANILIYARGGMSEQCRRFLVRCAEREVSGVLSSIALAEFCHRRMMQEAQSLGLSGSNSKSCSLTERSFFWAGEKKEIPAPTLCLKNCR